MGAAMIAIACSLSIQSCEEKKNHEDSAEMAEDENDRKFETKESEKNADLVAKSVECSYAVIGMSKFSRRKSNAQRSERHCRKDQKRA